MGGREMADEFAVKLQPSAFFIHHTVLDPDIEDAAFLVDAVIVDDVKFGFGEGRSDFVFDNFDFLLT